MDKKIRLDLYLEKNKLVDTRSKAKALIMSLNVLVNNEIAYKPSLLVSEKDTIRIKAKLKYVSRGGLKLEKAINEFNIDLNNKVCLDVGASTGGFIDCMLQNNALKVYALDVGYNQLDWKIKTNNKVVNIEKQNFRYASKELFKEEIDFISCDVSFISLKLIIPNIFNILSWNKTSVLLIKPQFESKYEKIKNGFLKDKNEHLLIVEEIIKYLNKFNFSLLNFAKSPIKGHKKGNIEYLIYIKKEINILNIVKYNYIKKIIMD